MMTPRVRLMPLVTVRKGKMVKETSGLWWVTRIHRLWLSPAVH